MKHFIFCLLVTLSFAAFLILFHGCAQEEEVIEEKAPDTEVESQQGTGEESEKTGKKTDDADALEKESPSGPKAAKEAKEGEGK
jgi:hypothetical protein